jgi:hypothetical protein
MGLLPGRKRAKVGRLSALSAARPKLEDELALRPSGVAGICFQPSPPDRYLQAEQDLDELIGIVAQESGASVRRRSDSYGYDWLVVRERDLDRLVEAVGLAAAGLTKRGFGSRLLASLFRFDDREQPVFLVYGFKSGTFWPFVPAGEEKERLNEEELRLGRELRSTLPVEPRLERWLGLFDAPLDD